MRTRRTTIIALAVLAMGLTAAQAQADDYCFTDPSWEWYLQDYPRWHYEEDTVECWGSVEPYEILLYVQLELYILENALVEPNVINFEFEVSCYDEFFFGYFDINPGETYIEEQVGVGIYSGGEMYYLRELNTIPEGGGWIIIDDENSWIDRFTNTGVEPDSLGNLRALFN